MEKELITLNGGALGGTTVEKEKFIGGVYNQEIEGVLWTYDLNLNKDNGTNAELVSCKNIKE